MGILSRISATLPLLFGSKRHLEASDSMQDHASKNKGNMIILCPHHPNVF
jgi:hypothetical protein